MTILLAAIAAAGWGAADFLGGAFRRKTSVFVVVAVSQAIGLAGLLAVVAAAGIGIPDNARLLLAIPAGLCVSVELSLIYVAISRGDAFITAPIGALGATIAVFAGLAGGDRLDRQIAIGLVLALAGGGLSAWRSGSHPSAQSRGRTAVVCLAAAAAVAGALMSLHAAGRVQPYWAATIVDASTLVPAAVVGAIARRRAPRRSLPDRASLGGLGLAALAGIVGDVAFSTASRHGALSIVSAVSSLYPLATVLLGVAVQGQRAGRVQAAGIVLALAGAAVLGASAG
jgi:drug/metabolite transporter (DMT)-like permease